MGRVFARPFITDPERQVAVVAPSKALMEKVPIARDVQALEKL